MKPMLDNDIDNLFKSSLEDYEIKPTAGSWQKINSQLKSKQRKNNQPYWLAAASIVLVVALSFKFFGTKPEVIKLTGNGQTALIEEEVQPVEHSIKEPLKELSLDDVKKANEKHFLSLMAKTSLPLKEKKIIPKKNEFKNKDVLVDALPLSVGKDVKEETYKSQEIEIPSKAIVDAEEPVLVSAQQLENSSALNKEAGYSDEKRKIKSVGDLVNFVIAKVDNREQKLFQVSKTEESDMEITQINLGLIKYKKN